MLHAMAMERNRVGGAFANALRALRNSQQITQESLAEVADFRASYISMLESGARQPTITTIIALEQALGVAPGELVRRTVAGMKVRRIALPLQPRKRVRLKGTAK